jgi:hypothetical protein
MLAEMHLRAAVHDALAMDRLRATDQLTVFRPHPYKRSSGSRGVFPTAWSKGSTPTPAHISCAAIAGGLRAAVSLAPGPSVSAIRSEALATDEAEGLCHSPARL